ncbi:replication initiator [Dactylosporangium sucinum]|uniref:Replication initiation protein n=1 Tax=Dactylosporangium sucinum TaxID=1424081 RepID=A0A917TM55_9ACTN|nr:replication initiator [Dactylosporangium sucinum]GGM27654.1 replication initiation protein [Dactylosporangium sucinum]
MTTNTADEYWPWAVPSPRPAPNPATGNTGDGTVHGHSALTRATALERAASDEYPDWLHHIRGAAACRRPIRLAGQIHVNDKAGERVATYDTGDMPDGAIYTPCGNRRTSVCPSCAEVYRRDAYHLVKAGLQGERWGMPPLGEHIALFVTATAPSFGPVHHRVVQVHAADCRRKDGCTCRPQRCRPFGRTCPHGIQMRCTERHKASDSSLGQPLCLDCYDHRAQVVWNHEAPELWRRTIQQADRLLQRLGKAHGVDLRRRYLKVYEFQVRGVIHYHALIRLDGYDPDCPDAIVPPPPQITRDMFAGVVREAFATTAYTSAPHPANNGEGWRIGWGDKGLDIKHVNTPGEQMTLTQMAGYIAKYVTKSTEVTGLALRRVDDLTVDLYGDPTTHVGRLIRACWDLGEHPDWWRLRRYAHQYGYGGHIATKSRGFSATLGHIRLQRTIWRRTGGYPHLWTDDQAELILYQLGYEATGWITTGDALLANTAAGLARERADTAREVLADQRQSTTNAAPIAA